jgi:hypothetical protein
MFSVNGCIFSLQMELSTFVEEYAFFGGCQQGQITRRERKKTIWTPKGHHKILIILLVTWHEIGKPASILHEIKFRTVRQIKIISYAILIRHA